MMLTVLTPAEKLKALTWPVLETVQRFSLAFEDWLIVCAGFEDRAVGILRNAVAASSPFHVLLIRYRPVLSENKEEECRRICQGSRISYKEVFYDVQDPSGFGSLLLDGLSACRGRIYIDISGMSRLLITQTLVALGCRPTGFMDCFVAYTEAESYPPSQVEVEAELAKQDSDPTFSIQFLSSGVFEITVVPELSALAMVGSQTRLIAFPSLDEHHLIALQTELQPSRCSFIEGVPPDSRNRWRQKFIAKVNHLDEIRENAGERLEASTLDYRETLELLVMLYAHHAIRERLLLAPTGSKMQTVAVGIFRAMVHDVQIVYPTPRGFRMPADYTHGVGPLHCLPLGAFNLSDV